VAALAHHPPHAAATSFVQPGVKASCVLSNITENLFDKMKMVLLLQGRGLSKLKAEALPGICASESEQRIGFNIINRA
jgi:hypothetical protein